ncbi:hypothetical protein [Pseudomonas veronii]|mgnify:CR=1 FL=1|uniref:Methyltransferase n=1 Tax=Pseudomonas veronii TaxID=76761 RepID=A0A4V1DBY6_PSEVE|nr:hypothetical protein [Pseudomonas veronii]QCG68246.1 methyltransferase [Pseudomonas veronii]
MLSHLIRRREPHVQPLFTLGSLKLSDKVHWLASKGLIDPLSYVQRHLRGDWGDVNEASRKANVVALEQEGPVRSRYRITPQLELIVITGDDHSTTIVQLPEERETI